MSDDGLEMKLDGLDKLLKALKAKPPVARVGILGDGKPRTEGGKSNAEIGAAHEFGTSTLPQRSFLRVPLIDNLDKRLESSGAFDKAAMADVLRSGSVVPWVKKVAVIAEGIVFEAFDTGGFGKWVPSNMDRKKNHQTLVETQQLRDSITSEVKDE